MDYLKANEKIKKIQSSGMYNSEQIEALKYAIYRSDINEDSFLDPDNVIPAEYIYMYIKLISRKKNIDFYIKNKWHNLGFNPSQLENIIYGHLGKVDISDITSNMSELDIKKIINERINLKNMEKDNYHLCMKLNSLGFSTEVINFFINKFESDPGIEYFFTEQYTMFSLEQIKYLYSLLSTGFSIDSISDPSLSVDDMKRIVLNSEESIDFINKISHKKH